MVAPCPPLETVGLADLFLGRPRSRRYPKFNIRRDIPLFTFGWNLRSRCPGIRKHPGFDETTKALPSGNQSNPWIFILS